jgi:hypothetical protein
MARNAIMPECHDAMQPPTLSYGHACQKHSYISVCCESQVRLLAPYLTPILDPFKILIHS